MQIVVLNGSPKGKNSVTLQTIHYLEKRHPEHTFTVLNVGQKIKKYEKDFTEAREALEAAELVMFSYPVYTFLAPYQLHRFIELMKMHGLNLEGKFATQVSTSKHFYDTTAHKYIEENCYDFGMKYIRGLSADMDDLLTEKGQKEADCYFDKLLFDKAHAIYTSKTLPVQGVAKESYQARLKAQEKKGNKDVVIVTNVADEDTNLQQMIVDFKANLPYPIREINIRKYPFSGGCLGCFECAISGKCVYKDGFDDYLREEIQQADAIVYAFTIEDHYTHSSFKCYDDRQFCNGHRSVTMGMPVGYIISGNYEQEYNVQTIVEARSEVGGVYLCGVATDEGDTTKALTGLSLSLDYALKHQVQRPANFYGVGGMKIFRDLIYIMQGMMKADHKFYKAHGIYDFPQKQKGKMLQMKAIGSLMAMPSVKKKMKGKMNDYIIMPYVKLIEKTQPKQ